MVSVALGIKHAYGSVSPMGYFVSKTLFVMSLEVLVLVVGFFYRLKSKIIVCISVYVIMVMVVGALIYDIIKLAIRYYSCRALTKHGAVHV